MSTNTGLGTSPQIKVKSLIIYIDKCSPPTSIISEKGIYRGELLELSNSSMVVHHTHKWNVPNSQESPSMCHAEGLLEIRAGNNS